MRGQKIKEKLSENITKRREILKRMRKRKIIEKNGKTKCGFFTFWLGGSQGTTFHSSLEFQFIRN